MRYLIDEMIYNNWGKTTSSDEKKNPYYHLLVYHCLDVAAVGRVLLQHDDRLLNQFIKITSLDKENTLDLITFYLAIHDLGKFSERFQNLSPDIFNILRGCTCNKKYTLRHDSMGYYLWREILSCIWDENLLGLDQSVDKYDWQDVLEPWFQAVTGHHGKPPQLDYNGIPIDTKSLFTEEDITMAQSFVKTAASLIIPNESKSSLINWNVEMEDAFKRSSWLLAGLVILSDWLGSNNEYFPYFSKPVPLEDYWNKTALLQAELAVRTAGILPSSASRNTGMNALFPKIKNPSPLQSYVSTCKLVDSPQLFIIEEVTGGGKTEAALTLAHRLMVDGLAEGIFVALPTMATANAMYERLVEAYRKMFVPEDTPSLVLAHGARHLSDTFRKSIGLEDSHVDGVYDIDEETASAQCSEWLADNRKKALLADVGVGTVDQGLMAVLPSKHQSLRLIGLSRNVLIVDEVHAYDPYMHSLLCTLLQFHAALGGSAILLSATLPMKHRQELINSFSQGVKGIHYKINNNTYPLVTHVTEQYVSETSLTARKGTQRTIAVKFLDDISKVKKHLLYVAKKGGCACWVRNTVDDAVDAYKLLSSELGHEQVTLFHARFAMGDRLTIENKVLRTFGKDSTNDMRKGQILIATQVVEQSLDLDFDYMISDLAPIDLIIQRAGRLHRHSVDKRGERGTPTLGIFAPLLTNNLTTNWYADVFIKAAYVYPSHGQLWLTARLLEKRGKIIMPDYARDLIESVFGISVKEKIPEALKKRDEKVEGEIKAAISIARLNALNLAGGYKTTIDHWLDDTVTPTRIGEATINVRLARWDGKTIIPWSIAEDFAWELSQVNINQRKIKDMAEYDGPLKIPIEEALDSMPDKGKWSVLVLLTPTIGEDWYGCAVDEHGKEIQIIYNPTTGLNVIPIIEEVKK